MENITRDIGHCIKHDFVFKLVDSKMPRVVLEELGEMMNADKYPLLDKKLVMSHPSKMD